MDEVKIILDKLKAIMIDLGFKTTEINGVTNYVYKDLYCIPQYEDILGLGFLIEYADSLEEAQKGWHGDGACVPLKVGEKAILEELKAEVIENMKAHM